MFVRFSCDCVGLIGVQGSQPLIICPCDRQYDDDSTSLHPRDMSDKTYEPLSDEEAAKLVAEMARALHDGYKFRHIQRLLKD